MMNRAVLILLTLIVGANVWLVARQQRQERLMEALRTENVRLAEALVERPSLSPEEFRIASQRLENAGAFVTATEGRLKEASSLLGQLQTAAQHFTAGSRPGVARSSIPRGDYPPVPAETGLVTGDAEATFGAPVSSHAPDGQMLQRNWGPEQVVGPPNTHEAGDLTTAWAPLSSQGGQGEWLHVDYAQAVDISEVRVRETYNPGAIAKLAAVLPNGEEVVIWEGVTPLAQAPADTSFPVPTGVQANSVKIYLDRTRAPGWNEIDAVELIGRDGTRQWAKSATASTSFAVHSAR